MDIVISPPPFLEISSPSESNGLLLQSSPKPLIVVPGPPIFSLEADDLIPPPADINPSVHPAAIVSPRPPIQLEISDYASQALADFPELVNLSGSDLLPGAPVASSGVNGVVPARCDSCPLATVVGLAAAAIAPNTSGRIQTDGVITLTAAQWENIIGQPDGLAPGATYYLSPFPGELIHVPPSAQGFYLTRIGTAISSAALEISIQPPIGM
ncbi:hypothetical protein HNI00_07250 [Thermoleptolyngbya oregonensis NK1-22]|uniref:Uncharacterized protein n=1 Tax=Thermoleptolyngbya oregonensis NK1-22 TaxID=2547457 RepID=A0AA97BLB6_9CYAN|nr:hypothetical protein [Thermoleptolyngbya oregonensis]WOB42972.1 hypothetical protein HNI00_07250 [Thermoleptolyngbya oregonensis NK1-22]